MKTRKRKVRLRITAASRQVVRLAGLRLSAHCPACGREVEALTRAEAGAVLEVGELGLGALIAAGRVHAIPTVSGQFKFCKDSLFVRTQAAEA